MNLVNKQFILSYAKISFFILIILFAFLYFNSLEITLYGIINYFQSHYLIVLFVFILSFLNWFLEACKTFVLTNYFFNFSMYNSFKSVYVGSSLGFFTPNRIGSVIGRLYNYPNYWKKYFVFLNIIPNIYQLLLTLFFGLFALSYFKELYFPFSLSVSSITFFVLSFLVIFIFLFCRFKSFFIKLKKLLFKLSFSVHLKLALLSFFRYSVFILQYYLIIHSFELSITFITILHSVSLLFLLLFLLPITSFGGIGARDVLLPIILPALPAEFSLLTTVVIWFVNALIPAFIGWVLFLNYKGKNL